MILADWKGADPDLPLLRQTTRLCDQLAN